MKQLYLAGMAVLDASVEPLHSRPADVLTYNAAARKIMDENGIAIDDLYVLALPRLTEIEKPANVHFTDRGSELLARRVVESILSALKKRSARKNRQRQ